MYMNKLLISIFVLFFCASVEAKDQITVFGVPGKVKALFNIYKTYNDVDFVEFSGSIERAFEENGADLVFASNIINLYGAQKSGKTDSFANEAEIKNKINNEFVFNTDAVAIGYRIRALMFKRGTKEPTSYNDLAKAENKGKVCMIKFNHDYNEALMAWMMSNSDYNTVKTWYDNVKANLVKEASGNDKTQAELISEEKCELSLINTYYFWHMAKNYKQQSAASKVSIVYPESGGFTLFNAVALSKESKNKKAASLFVNFLLDPLVQSYLSEGTSFSPVAKDAIVPIFIKNQVKNHNYIISDPIKIYDYYSAVKKIHGETKSIHD